MKKKIESVDEFLSFGCGRCDKGGTSECKVHDWAEELAALRKIALDAGLTETLKWSQPCYTYQDTNVILVSAYRDTSIMSFFRASLLNDRHKILQLSGENTQNASVVRLSSLAEIKQLESVLHDYIQQSIAQIKMGTKVEKQKATFSIPIELQQKLDTDQALNQAFQALTPGRQRSYVLHISAAKQEKTRMARVEKCMPKIFDGLGFNEYTK